jgi:hypothetical protein
MIPYDVGLVAIPHKKSHEKGLTDGAKYAILSEV